MSQIDPQTLFPIFPYGDWNDIVQNINRIGGAQNVPKEEAEKVQLGQKKTSKPLKPLKRAHGVQNPLKYPSFSVNFDSNNVRDIIDDIVELSESENLPPKCPKTLNLIALYPKISDLSASFGTFNFKAKLPEFANHVVQHHLHHFLPFDVFAEGLNITPITSLSSQKPTLLDLKSLFFDVLKLENHFKSGIDGTLGSLGGTGSLWTPNVPKPEAQNVPKINGKVYPSGIFLFDTSSNTPPSPLSMYKIALVMRLFVVPPLIICATESLSEALFTALDNCDLLGVMGADVAFGDNDPNERVENGYCSVKECKERVLVLINKTIMSQKCLLGEAESVAKIPSLCRNDLFSTSRDLSTEWDRGGNTDFKGNCNKEHLNGNVFFAFDRTSEGGLGHLIDWRRGLMSQSSIDAGKDVECARLHTLWYKLRLPVDVKKEGDRYECDVCGTIFFQKDDPFRKYDWVYCSIKCVGRHREAKWTTKLPLPSI